MAFNSPFWDFFDSINDEVDQFNRLLASNGYDDRVKVSPSSRAITNGNENDDGQNRQVSRRNNKRGNNKRNGDRSLIFPSLFNEPSFFSNELDVVPPVDILDNDNNYELHVSIPGAQRDKINLDFNSDKNEITVSGEIPAHVEDKNLKVQERTSGKFERHISLPLAPKLDENNIKANYSNGVLTLKIPKLGNENSNSRRIEITSSESWGDESKEENKE